MPASSWSGGTGPDGAMRATTIALAQSARPHSGGQRTDDGDVIGPSCPRRRGDRELAPVPARLFHCSPVAPTMFQSTWRTSATPTGGDCRMTRRRLIAAAAVTVGITGSAVGISNAAEVESSGRADHPAPGARPGHGDAAADGLQHRRQHLRCSTSSTTAWSATTPRRPSRTPTSPRASRPPTTRCGRSRSSPT